MITIDSSKEPIIWFRDQLNPAFANLPSAPFKDFLNAFCKPTITFMFGPTDTDPLTVLIPQKFNLVKIIMRPFDIDTKTYGGLDNELQAKLYINGTEKAVLETNGSDLTESVLSPSPLLTEGDIVSVYIDISPGSHKQLLISLIGEWS